MKQIGRVEERSGDSEGGSLHSARTPTRPIVVVLLLVASSAWFALILQALPMGLMPGNMVIAMPSFVIMYVDTDGAVHHITGIVLSPHHRVLLIHWTARVYCRVCGCLDDGWCAGVCIGMAQRTHRRYLANGRDGRDLHPLQAASFSKPELAGLVWFRRVHLTDFLPSSPCYL